MLQGEGGAKDIRVVRVDEPGQGGLYVKAVIAGENLVRVVILPQVDALAHAAVQIHGVHHLVPALEDGRHLHVPLAACQLEALPQGVVDILEAENGGLDLAGLLVGHHLHQVPAVSPRHLAAVDQRPSLLSRLGGGTQLLEPCEGHEAVHVPGMDRAASGEIRQLAGEGAITRLPPFGVRNQYAAAVLDQVRVENLAVGVGADFRYGV